MLVLGAPLDPADPHQSAVQQGLEGFVRSLGKEIGGGRTVNLLRLTDPAAAESTLRFLLSPKSAYVDGQVIEVGEPEGANQCLAEVDRDRPLAGRTALVTGAARGIGEALVRTLARDGARVVCLDVPSAGADLDRVASSVGGDPLALDITAPDAAARIGGALPDGLDVLVHNAGITRDRRLANMSADRWNAVLDVNLGSVLRTTEALLGEGVLRRGGRVVATASISGIAGNTGQTNYATSKAGIVGMVRALAPVARAEHGVTVNAVAPGFIETAMTAAVPLLIREAGRRMTSSARAACRRTSPRPPPGSPTRPPARSTGRSYGSAGRACWAPDTPPAPPTPPSFLGPAPSPAYPPRRPRRPRAENRQRPRPPRSPGPDRTRRPSGPRPLLHPALLPSYARGALLSPLRRRPRPGAVPPPTRLVVPGVRIDLDRLAAYERSCGFATGSDALPVTYPHVLAFPLAMRLMAGRGFPLPLLGLVHTSFEATQRHPLRTDTTYELAVRVEELRPHRRGTEAVVVTGARAAAASSGSRAARIWPGTAPPPRRGPPRAPLPRPAPRRRRVAAGPGRGTAVRGRLGRPQPDPSAPARRPPVRLPRPLAHGMWTVARCLAEQPVEGAVRVRAEFRAPVLLPATVTYAADGTGGFQLRTGERPHLTGTVTPRPKGQGVSDGP